MKLMCFLSKNMDWSMSYNPLALAIAAAKKGYYEKTQTYVNAVAESIFPKQKVVRREMRSIFVSLLYPYLTL